MKRRQGITIAILCHLLPPISDSSSSRSRSHRGSVLSLSSIRLSGGLPCLGGQFTHFVRPKRSAQSGTEQLGKTEHFAGRRCTVTALSATVALSSRLTSASANRFAFFFDSAEAVRRRKRSSSLRISIRWVLRWEEAGSRAAARRGCRGEGSSSGKGRGRGRRRL